MPRILKSEKVQYPDLVPPLSITRMKWNEISMKFIKGLSKSREKDVILAVVDRLTKYAHFLPLSNHFTVDKVADIFMNNI